MPAERASVLRPVLDDLQRIFGPRLEALVAYGWRQHDRVPSLALVSALSFDDLQSCAASTAAWHRAGAATPLVLTRHEFERSLDAFPIEYGEIIAAHDVVFGRDPLDGLSIDPRDLRRACEVQVKSHVLHLREDYLESAGRHRQVDALVRESAPAFVALLRQLARLDGIAVRGASDLAGYAADRLRLDARTVGDVISLADGDGMTSADPVKLFPAYLEAMDRLADFVDRWRE